MSKQQLLLIGLGLLLVALLVPLLQDVVRAALVMPLLYLLWFGRLLFESVPQRISLVFLIGIGLLLAWRSLVSLPGPVAMRATERVPQGRVAVWMRLLRQAEADPYSDWLMKQRLAQLAQEVLVHEDRLSPREVRQGVTRGTLEMPADVRASLRAGIDSYRPPRRSSPLARLGRTDKQTTTADTARVVAFLEARLREGPGGERDE